MDPADCADEFEELLGRAESYLGYRVRLEIERAPDRQEAFVRVREVLSRFDEDSPERQDAVRLAADRLDLPKETQAGFAPGRGAAGDGGDQRRACWRRALGSNATRSPGSPRIPSCASCWPSSRPTTSTRSCTAGRGSTCSSRASRTRSSCPLLAELDARAATEGIDEETAKELLLRLRERQVRRELATADLERTKELQEQLEKSARPRRISPRRSYNPLAEHRSPVAQLAEHPAVNRRVVGSSPTRGVLKPLKPSGNSMPPWVRSDSDVRNARAVPAWVPTWDLAEAGNGLGSRPLGPGC